MTALVEIIARRLADRRRRREAARDRRRAARMDQAEAKRAEEARVEAERIGQRLELARKLLTSAEAFATTPEGAWALATYRRWWLAADLAVGADGAIWRLGEHHGWGSVPDQRIDAPEVLAAKITTKDLALALNRLERPRVWRRALEIELLYRLWPRTI